MDFIKIDKEKWQRKKVFELYSKDILCTYSMTINLDITGLKNKTAKIFSCNFIWFE